MNEMSSQKPNMTAPSISLPAYDAMADDRREARNFHNAKLHRLVASSRKIRALTIGIMARLELALLAGHKETEVIKTIRLVRKQRESLLSGNEAFTVFSMARAQRRLEGVMAEVGVYEGGSAKLISTGSGGVTLHIFDTFDGLPVPDACEKARLSKGLYAASFESVQKFLSGSSNIIIHPGLFPESGAPCDDLRFSFVHLDVDLKSSTLSCLEYFYPRMVAGGIILTHDYSYLDGVRSAFSEFFALRRELPIELPSSQAMVIKL